MTDVEVIKAQIGSRLMCSGNCFALANRFLNQNGYRARVEYQSMDGEIVEFIIVPHTSEH